MIQEAKVRDELVCYSHAMHKEHWVANHDGNLSARVDEDRIICTPTSFSKLDITHDDLLVVNQKGQKIAGRRRAFSELNIHLEIYRSRSDVHAVIHSHAPFATAFGTAQKIIPHPFLPEAVVSLGANIPLVPLRAPGQESLDAISPWIKQCDALVVAGNGVWSWGPTLELAYLRMELVEHLAKVAYHAVNLGGVTRLPPHLIHTLLMKRHKGGLRCPEETSVLQDESNHTIDQVLQNIKKVFPNISQDYIEKLVQESLQKVKG
jgi:L-fuculose-phosphate aldolase